MRFILHAQAEMTRDTQGLCCKSVRLEALQNHPNLRMLVCERILISRAGTVKLSMPALNMLRIEALQSEDLTLPAPPVNQSPTLDVSDSIGS